MVRSLLYVGHLQSELLVLYYNRNAQIPTHIPDAEADQDGLAGIDLPGKLAHQGLRIGPVKGEVKFTFLFLPGDGYPIHLHRRRHRLVEPDRHLPVGSVDFFQLAARRRHAYDLGHGDGSRSQHMDPEPHKCEVEGQNQATTGYRNVMQHWMIRLDGQAVLKLLPILAQGLAPDEQEWH